jgi:hypothetical protein
MQDDIKIKSRIYVFIGIGIAALLGAYQFATEIPKEGAPSMLMPFLFVSIAAAFFALAATMALKLRKES